MIVRLLEQIVERSRQRSKRQHVGHTELLAGRQTDRTRQNQLVFLHLVLLREKPLLLGPQLHFGAQHVDPRHGARFLLVGRAVEQRLRRVNSA